MTLFETLKQKPKDSVVITLISGGGSALLSAPAPNVTLDDIRQTTNVLLACGATIHEINSIRKHLSMIKGGHLAEAAYPNPCYSLILSDVMGDDLSTIASGPTHQGLQRHHRQVRNLEQAVGGVRKRMVFHVVCRSRSREAWTAR